MRLAKVISTLVFMSLLVRPVAVFAQGPGGPAPDPWGAVRSLPMRSEVVVKLTGGKALKGSLIASTDDGLSVSLGESISTLGRDSVRKVYHVVRKKEDAKTEVIATIVGGGAGVALILGDSEGSPPATAVVMIGLLFAGLGYAVGRAFRPRQKQLLIYEARK